MKNKQQIAVVISALLLSSCANLLDTKPLAKPDVEFPQAWPGLPQNAVVVSDPEWWKLYQDSALDTLVQEALQNNPDVAIAAARIEEVRAQVVLASADEDPTATATFEPSLTKNTQRGGSFRFPTSTRDYTAKINISYEIDLWDKLRNATDAARADLLATELAKETITQALITQVVQSYFAVLALNQQIAVAARAEDTRKAALELQRLRFKAGITSEFEVRQLEAELAAIQVQIPALKNQRTQQGNTIALLLGKSPKAMLDGLPVATSDKALPENVVPAGLPSELLLRRPDLREAEQRLVAANGRVNVARAAYYPSISLTGFLGTESRSLTNLFSAPTWIANIAGQLTQPLFGAKRIGASVKEAEAREQQLVVQYQKAISTAFSEVQNALSARQSAREVLAANNVRVTALEKTLMLVRLRYENGVSNQLEVLDAERNLLQAKFDRIDTERLQRFAIADLFRAMGGGWKPETVAAVSRQEK